MYPQWLAIARNPVRIMTDGAELIVLSSATQLRAMAQVKGRVALVCVDDYGGNSALAATALRTVYEHQQTGDVASCATHTRSQHLPSHQSSP